MQSFSSFLVTEELAEYLPQFFEFLQKQPDDVVVHFTDFFRVGINPHPSHHDPIGVYTFPKKYVLSAEFRKNAHFFSMNYAFILKPKGGKILNLSTVTLPEVERLIAVMGLAAVADKSGSGHLSVRQGYSVKPGHVLWDVMEKALQDKGPAKNNPQWNKLFKKAGIDILVDDGDAIIHSNEPCQVVFLTPGTYQEVTYFRHDVGNIFKSTSIKVMKELAAMIFDDNKHTMSVKNKNSETVIYMNGEYKKNPIQLWGTCYKRDKLDQTLAMRINFASHLGQHVFFDISNEANRVEVSFDMEKPNIKQQVSDIAKLFMAKMDEPGFFRVDKSHYAELLMKEVMRILGLHGVAKKEPNRECYDFKKSLKNFGILDISVSYFTNDYSEDKIPYYHLGMSLKSKIIASHSSPHTLYGTDKATIPAHYVEEEGRFELAARKLIRKTLTYWKETQERLYPTDSTKYPASDWNYFEKVRVGEHWQKFFAWLEDKLAGDN